MAVAFFDFDKTLIDCNSGSLWIRSELRAGRMPVRTAVWGSWQMFLYHLGHGDMERVYAEAVRTLQGETVSALETRTERWFADKVTHRVRPGALRALRRHREAGDQLVIATSSSDFQAELARRTLDMDAAIGTVFETRDDVFTGGVASWAFGHHKADRILDWAEAHDVDLSQASFYTDSITDLRCMELVGDPVAVNPDPKLAKLATERGWRLEDWGTADTERGRSASHRRAS